MEMIASSRGRSQDPARYVSDGIMRKHNMCPNTRFQSELRGGIGNIYGQLSSRMLGWFQSLTDRGMMEPRVTGMLIRCSVSGRPFCKAIKVRHCTPNRPSTP